MNVDEQGVSKDRKQRYQAIPRTLILVTSVNPGSGEREVLLLKGAADKRLWANKYNGLGGHVEADEDLLSAAERELAEESGLAADNLRLRGVVNIDTGRDEMGQRPGVLMFVFTGESRERQVRASGEGAPEWIPVTGLAGYALVDDLYEVIPRALGNGPFFFGHYRPRVDGEMIYEFRQ
jgi:8-oxo-dGTP diphosphatase